MLESRIGGLTDMKIANKQSTSLIKRLGDIACAIILCLALCVVSMADCQLFNHAFNPNRNAIAAESNSSSNGNDANSNTSNNGSGSDSKVGDRANDSASNSNTSNSNKNDNNISNNSANNSKKSNINSFRAKHKTNTFKRTNLLSKGLSLKILQATPVVTETSGYHLSVSLYTAKNQTLPKGTVNVFVNPYHTFVSRTDMQKWSEGQSRIPTMQLLGTASVKTMAANSSRTINVDVKSDSANIKTIRHWGPKPLLITYTSEDGKHYISLTSFLTRSNDGLPNPNTPPIDITAVMPILANPRKWKVTIPAHKLEENVGNSQTENKNKDTKDNKDTKYNKSSDNSKEKTKEKEDSSKDSSANHSVFNFPNEIKATLSLDQSEDKRIIKQVNLAVKHNKLQTIADPETLKISKILYTPNLFMQKDGFDISSYAEDNYPSLYKSAGIAPEKWSAKESCKIAGSLQDSQKKSHNEINCKNLKTPVIAWQTSGRWTLNALTQAKINGYNTVISTNGFDPNANRFAINTGVYKIPTNAGEIKVLSSQEVLTQLANGKATNELSTAESTEAGRIIRLVAQSAFYQMEQPYASRHLLVTFNSETSSDTVDAVMKALEKSPWINLQDFESLTSSEPFENNVLRKLVPDNSGLNSEDTQLRNNKLQQLTKNREKLLNFNNNIIDDKKINKEKSDAGDAQALAKQHAKMGNLNKAINSKTWGNQLINAFDEMALIEILSYSGKSHFSDNQSKENKNNSVRKESKLPDKTTENSISENSEDSKNGENGENANAKDADKNTDKSTDKANKNQTDKEKSKQNDNSNQNEFTTRTLVNSLVSGIRIIPPKNITVVSETASLPVVVSNSHPYPIKVYVAATTQSMEIVLARKTLVSVPANSETQVTLPVRVTTSTQTKATLSLEDRQHDTFSQSQFTTITGTLQISDKSGTIIIMFAFALGIWGLWRQFHRKKDPNE